VPWFAGAFIAAMRGLALIGLIAVEALLWALVACAMALVPLGIGLFLLPWSLKTVRSLANLFRRLAGEWSNVQIKTPYRAPPPAQGKLTDWRENNSRLLTDPATWRDLLWLTIDPLGIWAVLLIPGTIIAWGLIGIMTPVIWKPVVEHHGNNWYAMIHVTSWSAAWLSVPLGVAFVLVGISVGPPVLKAYFLWARLLLAPTRRAELAMQVRHLTTARADIADAGANEVRRIERDLHDGAQARLVAMGMTLRAAERMLDKDPAAVRALLVEARETSSAALSELRDLVRGIHPPVLADRGLPDAVRAIALDNPLRIEVTDNLGGRRLEPAVESAAYFAVCELLANVGKHAGANEARVSVEYEDGRLKIIVADDGVGGARIAAEAGLAGLERRLAAFDGVLALSSPPGGPTLAAIEIPCLPLSSLPE
jgi:signal transduction histidine kinase